MSTFVKKATSAVAGLAVVFSMVSPIAGVSAALSGVEAANQLATLGVVVDQSANPADYRLGDNLPRKEAVKVMMNLSSVAVVDNCSGQFSDLTSADWACKYAETALANGLVAANASFRPDDLVSKIEALKMVFQGMDMERDDNADWRAGYVDAAVSMGIATSFSDYDTPATRAEMFIWAAEAINMDDEEVATEDPLCDLLGICEEEGTDEGTEEAEGETETPVVPAGSSLQVSLSPSTPAATTIPGNVNGLAAAAFDFTAGSSDVTVSQVSVKRNGLSDEDTLDSLAIFTDAGRVSNSKSDNQDNDTTAQINLDNGGVVVEAGETVTMVVVVDVNAVLLTANDEFALSISDVSANADVTGLGVQGATMKIGSVDAPQITFANNGSVSNPNLGEVAADIFEFEIQGDNDEDVMVESITFEGSSDAEDDLRNFELLMGNKVVATTAMMSGDYLTFDVSGLLIEEDKNEDFTVRADVIDGAGDTISFDIDANLDVTANSTKFGFGAGSVIAGFNPPSITIQAGELTFIEVDSEIEEIREDKDNVVLATFEIVNLSGAGLELEDFAATIAMTDAGTTTVGVSSPVAAVPATVFTEVELYSMDTGSSYELTTTSTTGTALYAENGVDAIVGEGTTTWMIRADTAEDITSFDDLSFDVSMNLDSGVNEVVINETMDDERVTDITPSSLSFNSIDGSESGASVNRLSLSPSIDVVRGAKEVVAFEFEVEAEEVSSLVVDELTVQLTSTAGNATKQELSLVNLYLDSVSAANLLDGDSLSNNGQVTFDDMGDVMIAANGRQTFVVTVDVVDGTDAVTNSPYTTSLLSISIEDDENDDIAVTGLPLTSNRSIVVTNAGEIATLALDAANEDNEFDKLGLAGDSIIIGSVDVRANNESVDVETAVFTIAGATGLANSVETADILLNGTVVGTAANSDITDTSITFEDLSELILPETTAELALRLNTANIGRNLVGVAQTNLQITGVELDDAEGVDSGKDVTTGTYIPGTTEVVASRFLDIVPAVVTPSVVSTFGENDTTAEIRLVVDGGNNTTSTGDAVQAEFTGFTYQSAPVTPSVENSNGVVVGASDSIGGDNEIYTLRIPVGAASEGTYTLAIQGVSYTVDSAPYTVKLENTLDFGTYNED